jgi:hypothetical protein
MYNLWLKIKNCEKSALYLHPALTLPLAPNSSPSGRPLPSPSSSLSARHPPHRASALPQALPRAPTPMPALSRAPPRRPHAHTGPPLSPLKDLNGDQRGGEWTGADKKFFSEESNSAYRPKRNSEILDTPLDKFTQPL